jgi:SAM-dependent methyltransferase
MESEYNGREYKYNEATVRFYDIVYDQLAYNEREGGARAKFYFEEIAKAKGPVLEAGFGTGKILVPALKSGADIYGIDLSELMYKRTEAKLAENELHRISLQDLRSFTLDKKFSLVVSPFRVFQHLITIEDQLKALGKIYEHLEEGGLFIFDLFCPALQRLHTEVNDLLEFEGEYEPGKYMRRYYSVKPDYMNQVQFVTFRYVWDENSKELSSEYPFPMRYFFRFEIEHLVTRAGFKIQHFYGGFDRSELGSSPKEFIIVCRK